MILKLEGNINSLYVQSLCMMFFRGEKFPLVEENPRGELSVKSLDTVDGVECTAILTYDGKTQVGYGCELLDDDSKYGRISKLAVGHAVFEACVKLTGYIPPWGLLTGIRPSVVASELLEDYDKKTAIEMLQNKYLLSKEKACLVVDVALNEQLVLNQFGENSCSLYISIPFCPTRCSYCSFVSYATEKLFTLIPKYLVKLISEIEETFSLIDELGLELSTIYIGGGTPTTLEPYQIEQLLRTIRKRLNGKKLKEFTVEAGRPDTITEEKLKVLKEYGVDRISVNPQSLNNEVLQRIGRRHTVEDFFNAFSLVKSSNFNVINTDLIAGLDGDSLESFERTVDEIIMLDPENITVHSFSVKKSAQILKENNDAYVLGAGYASQSVEYAFKTLTSKGYVPYYMYKQKNTVGDLENVGYAKEGTFCDYNVLMMGDGHTIFGIGAGSSTKLVKTRNGKKEILRIFSPKYPYEYLQDNQSNRDKIIDFLMKGEAAVEGN